MREKESFHPGKKEPQRMGLVEVIEDLSQSTGKMTDKRGYLFFRDVIRGKGRILAISSGAPCSCP